METAIQDLLAHAERLPGVDRLLTALGTDFEPTVWLVGGPVRDLLLGRDPTDLDLLVAGPPAAVADALGAELTVFPEYLTARVGGFDIAHPRRERYPHPGGLPVVEVAGTVEEDLGRRDFTVNALALALTGSERGRALAVDDALDDLAARQLRVLHDRSFIDDPTRLLRLARYAARLDFGIEPTTRALAAGALRDRALDTVSGVRIGNELRKLAAEADPVAAFGMLRALRIDQAIDPAVGLLDPALAQRGLRLLEPGDRRDRTVLAAALLGASRDHLLALLDHLGFGAEDRDVIVRAAVDAERISRRLEFASPPSQIDWAAGGPGTPAELIALAGAIHPANAAREWLVSLRHQHVSITGADLIAAGVPAGPAVGAGLAAARAALLDHEAPDAESQLAVALEAAGAT